ncbi:MAG: TonB-dependent receptor [Gammaproteobacteria bacterium]|nr:TonB-dependent receptor [Gammaproteobacteria bacterium]
MYRIFLLLSGLSFYLLSLNTAIAEQADKLETVIVSATRSNVTDLDFPGAITVISSEEIRMSGASHLVEVLRSAGGVQISDLYGDGTDASVGIRGFSETAQQNTLIMIDGRRLNNADNGLPDLNTIALRNIDRIEIIKGSAGTLYGDKAVGGVINIITREPEKLQVEGEMTYGSFDNRSAYASVENAHANGIHYRFSALRHLSDNYRDNNELRLTDIAASAGYTHASGELFLEYQDLNEDVELPGSLFADMLAADRTQALYPSDFVATDSRIARAGIRQEIIEGVELQAEYTNRKSDSNGQLSSGGFPNTFIQKRKHTEFTPRLIGTFEMPAGQTLITIGGDLFKTDYLITSPFGITDDTQSQYSAYTQGIVPLTENLALTLGARHGTVQNDIMVDTLAFGRSLPAGTELDDSANAYEGGLSYLVNDNWRVFGKVDRNFRFVTADEYSAVADNNFFANLFLFGTVVPLPETQTGLSYESGIEWHNDSAQARLQLFQLDLDNEIVFDPSLFLNTNIGDTRRRGLIFEGRYAPAQNWDIYANYSYIDGEVTSGGFDGSDLTFLADHSVTVGTRYRYDERLSGYLEIIGVSDRIFGGDFANAFEKLPGYAVANMQMSYQYNHFTLSLRVNNLLDKEYSDSGNIGFDFRDPMFPQVKTFFPAPERNLLFSLRYNYQ